MENNDFKVFIIDDDDSVRRSLVLVLESAGYITESFSGIGEFRTAGNFTGPGCILLDIFLGDDSGMELQEEIKSRVPHLPIIYITGFGNIPMSVQALKKGAINFLQKPVDDNELLIAINEALSMSRELLDTKKENDRLSALFGNLTTREMEILSLVLEGKLNKQIASELNIAEHTVKIHRGNITRKLGVKSVAEMAKIAQKLDLH